MSFRLGAGLLGAMVGLVPSFMLAIGFAVADALPRIPFEAWVFGLPVVLGVASFLRPPFAFALFPAVAHMLLGAAKQAGKPHTSELPDPEHSAPDYLKISFYAGVAAIIVIAAFAGR